MHGWSALADLPSANLAPLLLLNPVFPIPFCPFIPRRGLFKVRALDTPTPAQHGLKVRLKGLVWLLSSLRITSLKKILPFLSLYGWREVIFCDSQLWFITSLKYSKVTSFLLQPSSLVDTWFGCPGTIHLHQQCHTRFVAALFHD